MSSGGSGGGLKVDVYRDKDLISFMALLGAMVGPTRLLRTWRLHMVSTQQKSIASSLRVLKERGDLKKLTRETAKKALTYSVSGAVLGVFMRPYIFPVI